MALADPFGGDDVDFETEVYMANMLANTKAMISPSADYTPLMLKLAGKGGGGAANASDGDVSTSQRHPCHHPASDSHPAAP